MTTAGTLVLIRDMQERQWLSIPDLINPWHDVLLEITTQINQESRHGDGGARASAWLLCMAVWWNIHSAIKGPLLAAQPAMGIGTCEIEAVDSVLPKSRLYWINEAKASVCARLIRGVLIYFPFPAHPLQKWQCPLIDFTLRDQSTLAWLRENLRPPLPSPPTSTSPFRGRAVEDPHHTQSLTHAHKTAPSLRRNLVCFKWANLHQRSSGWFESFS